MSDISRRAVIKATAAIGAAMMPTAPTIATAEERPTTLLAAATPSVAADAPDHGPTITYIFFNTEEAAFIEAAVSRLIPADEKWPGAFEAGVPNYIDKQLAGAWGAGERLYRSGPWQQGTPSQGYQLPLTPSELFRTAIDAINKELAQTGAAFAKMRADQQDAYLEQLEAGGRNLGGVPSDVFFAHLLEATVEGFFADPVYGGNRDMMAWRMIGFPGAYASYYDVVDQHGIKIDRPPMSLAEDAHGRLHVDPGIPAHFPATGRK
jgi:gluconate 2-dehydrogenase gamma chain